MALRVEQKQINFIEKKGIKYLGTFWAKDVNGEPLKIHFEPEADRHANLVARDVHGTDVGNYQMNFFPEKSEIEGDVLAIRDFAQRKGIGQILSICGLMELWANKWQKFTLLTFERTLGFHTNLGFKIENFNPNFLLDGLKPMLKTRVPLETGMKEQAAELIPKLKEFKRTLKDPDGALQKGALLLSDYMKLLMRKNLSDKLPRFMTGAYMKFTPKEFETDGAYLNSMLKLRDIDFKFPEAK